MQLESVKRRVVYSNYGRSIINKIQTWLIIEGTMGTSKHMKECTMLRDEEVRRIALSQLMSKDNLYALCSAT